jgi:AcrR family transcriptional regulator
MEQTLKYSYMAREKIMQGYIEFELLNGRTPNSVFELTKKLKLEESTFYKYFGSLESLRKGIVTEFINSTTATLDEDPAYDAFTAREKLLALFFTLFEKFQLQRSYLLAKYGDIKKTPENSKDWNPFMTQLVERINTILSEAKMQEEIQDRPLIGNHYGKGFPIVFAYLFRVWIKDDSPEFATTDAAIEKSINLSFDMLGTSPLDSLIDFGKFAFKTKVF